MVKVYCPCGFAGGIEDFQAVILSSSGKGELVCPSCHQTSELDVTNQEEEKESKIVRERETAKENITTEKDFELFKKCVWYWVKFFGLYGWDIQLLHEDDDALAYPRFNVPNRSVSVVLAKNWDDREVTDIEIDQTAFHEVGERLMLKLRHIAEARYISNEEAGEEIHKVIRVLESVIWEPKIKELDERIRSALKVMDGVVKENVIKVRSHFVK